MGILFHSASHGSWAGIDCCGTSGCEGEKEEVRGKRL